ncbi:NucA/NucB deoxyribonuclease domain-containing protein [Streptomyces reticuli]|uniref:NucA/NucB deoxyribonuclease domain-containing protein n=1 Tax=Streptomyces reticuli TaxID=1926 RepID=UPI00073DECEA|nr:hypothetical protein TUE45_pSRTUE45b_0082 [Streptomyces reticuli]
MTSGAVLCALLGSTAAAPADTAAAGAQRPQVAHTLAASADDTGQQPQRSGQAVVRVDAGACTTARQQALSAGHKYAACVQPVKVSDGMRAAARDPMWKWPDWCDDHGVANVWYITRINGCGVFGVELKVLDTRGRQVGGIKYMMVGYEFSDRTLSRWAYQVALLEYQRWGQGTAGTKAQGSASCRRKCKVANGSFPSQTISASKNPYGQYFIDTTINVRKRGQKGSGSAVITHHFTNPAWGTSTPVELGTTDVRCDTALPGRTTQVGCINQGYVPEMVYNKRGEYPELAKHIAYAQDVKKLPGKHGTKQYLTRLTDKKKITKNRDKACPSSRPRPQGKSCDEYPFATTWQGASTGSGKFSWRMINARQNSQGGNALNNFYTYNRIIEKDRFLVWIK